MFESSDQKGHTKIDYEMENLLLGLLNELQTHAHNLEKLKHITSGGDTIKP